MNNPFNEKEGFDLEEALNQTDEMFSDLKEKAKPFHEILIEKRKQNHLERKDIVNLTGLSVASISRLESGQTDDLKVSSLKKLSHAYDIDYGAFLSGVANELDYDQIDRKRLKISKARGDIKESEEEISF